ncbi:hypothetical protein ACERNI_17735 [Camelimonas sp. ID_303_24]
MRVDPAAISVGRAVLKGLTVADQQVFVSGINAAAAGQATRVEKGAAGRVPRRCDRPHHCHRTSSGGPTDTALKAALICATSMLCRNEAALALGEVLAGEALAGGALALPAAGAGTARAVSALSEAGERMAANAAGTVRIGSEAAPAGVSNVNNTGNKIVTSHVLADKPGISTSDIKNQLDGYTTIFSRGAGAAEGAVPKGYTAVSRWGSADQAARWVKNEGTTIPIGIGADGRVYVTTVGAAKPGGTGPVRIDFSVPVRSIQKAGKSEWGRYFNRCTPIYNVQIHIPKGLQIPKAGK